MKHFRMSIIIIVAFFALYIYTLISSPLPIEVIDRDGSGIVSISEALSSSDIGTRTIMRLDETCIDYYWLKDGESAFEDCKPNP